MLTRTREMLRTGGAVLSGLSEVLGGTVDLISVHLTTRSDRPILVDLHAASMADAFAALAAFGVRGVVFRHTFSPPSAVAVYHLWSADVEGVRVEIGARWSASESGARRPGPQPEVEAAAGAGQ